MASPEEKWEIDDKNEWLAHPSPEYMRHLAEWLYEYRKTDIMIRFEFHPDFNSPDEFVHESRLVFQGGPFAALVERNFIEKNQKKVVLCADDDPATFKIIREFLYCKDVQLKNQSVDTLLRAIRSVHRWELKALFDVLLKSLRRTDYLGKKHPLWVLQAVELVSLPDVPRRFKLYFWRHVSKAFDHFTPEVKDIEPESYAPMDFEATNDSPAPPDVVPELPPIEQRLNPLFPNLWELAVEHGQATHILEYLVENSDVPPGDLLDLVMHYLEPRMQHDKDILEMMMSVPKVGYFHILKNISVDCACSVRALRLFCIAVLRRGEDDDHDSERHSD